MTAARKPSSSRARRPRLAVWKFASCDGCQLSLLDCEDELLAVGEAVEIAYFLEASSANRRVRGTYDLSLVEGSITTAHDVERIAEVRRVSRRLVTIGACATSGGIQALRNFARIDDFLRVVYARPDYIETLATSTPIAAHVKVDFELQGCPIDKRQLLEVLSAWLMDERRGGGDGRSFWRRPDVASHSVCIDCKLRGNVCVMVTGTPCLGPVTHAGCGALCPSYLRGCYGCFGPMETPNPASLGRAFRAFHVPEDGLLRAFRNENAARPPFVEGAADPGRRAASGEAGPVEPRLVAARAKVESGRG